MNLHTAENMVHRYLVAGRSIAHAPPVVRHALQTVDRDRAAREWRNEPKQFRLALHVHDELAAKGDSYKRRARVRRDLADYIERSVLPVHWDLRFYTAAEKLRNARDRGFYGFREDGSLVTCWDNKSGLSKLDPDEAREESQRLAERYGAHVLELAKKGRGLHYLVLTIPNVDVGELAEAQRAMFRKWINFKRIQSKKHQVFAEILGDIAIMESPLAADGKWNVHLNVLLVTQRRFHAGLYEKIRREWKFNCHMRAVKGDAGEIARAFNELLKYGLRTVPEKSNAKASRHATDAPAMTEWPVARFVEWFDAQHRFRRTRTYGCLYGSKVPKPEPRSLDGVTWLGHMSLGAEYFRVALPLLAGPLILVPGDKSTTKIRDGPTIRRP